MTDAASAEIFAPCADLGRALRFFESIGFRLEMIMPADSPKIVLVALGGTRLRLEESPEIVRLIVVVRGNFEDREHVSPDGVIVRFKNDAVRTPAFVNELVVAPADGDFHEGRAGMRYRDLIPSRLGGSVVASHISIPNGGPIPDYVHFHKIRFQLIYCLAGRARLVYENNGEPFWFEAGDCVLQPPEIRHRVLECSDGFEVLEVGSPAVHETYRDHEMRLPNPIFDPARDYRGQRFLHHKGALAGWNGQILKTRIGEASNGAVELNLFRVSDRFRMQTDGRFEFFFVARGSVMLLTSANVEYRLDRGGAVSAPEGEWEFVGDNAEIIRVSAPM